MRLHGIECGLIDQGWHLDGGAALLWAIELYLTAVSADFVSATAIDAPGRFCSDPLRAPLNERRSIAVGEAMRAIQYNHCKTIKPKNTINAKVKTVRLQANLKLTHWYEKASLSISAAK
ncbi:MAG TPA: hypothetical protein VF396_20225 [Bradyrhizobium sp.]